VETTGELATMREAGISMSEAPPESDWRADEVGRAADGPT